MLKLYYKDEYAQNYIIKNKLDVGKLKYIGEFKSEKEICSFIKDFWELRGAPVPYLDICYANNYIRIGYGSCTNSYYVTINKLDLLDSKDSFECNTDKLPVDKLKDLNSSWMRKQIEETEEQFCCINNLDITEVKVTGYDGCGHRVDIYLNEEELIRFKKFYRKGAVGG
ncbi:hypothetical protein CWE04_11245 [Thomasclavelia cocleata]|uniref:Uncharacterized protein n=1 Tax=Thomasclavelia cocleata TaxID=69824 RepID=A0A1I0BGM9_9FIRM|nr:hypothetical protein [Thomasclavelia cocleata]MCR1959897.1 hypothetical protein [Thomasclavelia cocleata]NDO41757.1 hypothetical protein [Thomasclavelia cocleata]PJN79784.1 hypothetical protein CWE04_11245 [Thomasclavelia cocleata]SET05372.1 hypothetical protein SAMN04489758_10195 [Thomasclavelia cocleata]